MRLFRKKKPEVQESSYEIFGGATIKKIEDSYEMTWKGANPMSITFSVMPEIDSNVETVQEGDVIRITSQQCKLKIVTENGDMKASLSEL